MSPGRYNADQHRVNNLSDQHFITNATPQLSALVIIPKGNTLPRLPLNRHNYIIHKNVRVEHTT